MNKKKMTCIGLLLASLCIAGCWDRRELNDLAIWLASGWDLGKQGNIEFSGQIVIPSAMKTQDGAGKGGGKTYLVVSDQGKNSFDAIQNIQSKLSRQPFFGQRRVILLGDKFAKKGIKEHLDGITRAPNVSTRTDMFVVKGGTAKDILKLSYPLEKIPIEGTIKEHTQIGGRGEKAFISFLEAVNSDGIRPTLPAMEVSHAVDEQGTPIFRMAGTAIFDKNLVMRGYLTMEEDRHLLWIMGLLKKYSITLPTKDGLTSVRLAKIKSKIIPHKSTNSRYRFTVLLRGEGEIYESSLKLDLMQPEYLKIVEDAINRHTEELIFNTIEKVQTKFKQDIFGFGESFHRKYPRQWKSLKGDWDNHFSKAEISVHSQLVMRRVGLTRTPSLIKESEIKK